MIEQGVKDYRATGSIAAMPMWLALEGEALYLADRTSDALEAISEAETIAKKFEVGWWYAELRRLRGVFLAAMGVSDTESFALFFTVKHSFRGVRLLSRPK